MHPKSRKKVKYQHEWENLFGIKPTSRDSRISEVLSVVCLFCQAFGREQNSENERKRGRTENVKYFQPPWRCDHIQNHVKTQHPDQYSKYQLSAKEERKCFFNNINRNPFRSRKKDNKSII